MDPQETNRFFSQIEEQAELLETEGTTASEKFGGIGRRAFFAASAGSVAGAAAALSMMSGEAKAGDLLPNIDDPDAACDTGEVDYSQIPQRLHEYPSSDRARDIVQKSITMDSLFSGIWPTQWSGPDAPEFHDTLDKLRDAGFKAIAACPSADALDTSIGGIAKSLIGYLKKINERPEAYRIVRTTADIDAAMAENKLGIFFTHQGTALFGGNPDMVGLWRQLGYGYCLLAYNARNSIGDGCFEEDNGRLTGLGKLLMDAYNRYGMIIDVSHTAERTAFDAIERSQQPVISSHSVAKAVRDYQRSHSDELIKAIAESSGIVSINTVGAFVDETNPDIVSTDILYRHIDHIVSLTGVDHVGYGSDWIPDITYTAVSGQGPLGELIFPDDGTMKAMSAKGVPTPAPFQIIHALVDKLLENGWSDADCGKFLGGNLYRVASQIWT